MSRRPGSTRGHVGCPVRLIGTAFLVDPLVDFGRDLGSGGRHHLQPDSASSCPGWLVSTGFLGSSACPTHPVPRRRIGNFAALSPSEVRGRVHAMFMPALASVQASICFGRSMAVRPRVEWTAALRLSDFAWPLVRGHDAPVLLQMARELRSCFLRAVDLGWLTFLGPRRLKRSFVPFVGRRLRRSRRRN